MKESKRSAGAAMRERARAERPAGEPETTSSDVEVLRCDCGRLLARVLNGAIELKCARCKRVVIIVGGRRFEERGTQACACLESLRIRSEE